MASIRVDFPRAVLAYDDGDRGFEFQLERAAGQPSEVERVIVAQRRVRAEAKGAQEGCQGGWLSS